MRFLISVAVAALTVASVQAQTPKEVELKKLREQIAALQKRIDEFPPDYWKASVQAAKERKPLVMFVGIGSMRQIEGAVVGQQDYGVIFDEQPPAIVVALPDGTGWINWRETLPADATDAQIRATFKKAVSQVATPFTQPPLASTQLQSAEPDARPGLPVGSVEAMDELNALRIRRGLHPFQRDDLLTIAAARAAVARAATRNAGHTSNDFAYVLAGSRADAAGCAAWEPGLGWGACCTYENWPYAGAAWAMGSDGRRYMHLYVRR